MSRWIVHVPAYKAVFLSQPKVASTSLLPFVGHLAGIDIDYTQLDFRRRLPGYPREEVHRLVDHFRFGFVRNPWARLVSCYAHTIVRTRERGRNCLPPFFRNAESFRLDMSFDEFAEAVVTLPDEQIDAHARSQYTFLVDSSGRALADFVGRFENLQEDWKYVCARTGFPFVETPHLNRSNHGPYRDYYSPRLRDLVSGRYARDLHEWSYDF
jgi:chondroitin 4-sulfotransferase 11